jgi:hypothetical protein
MLLVALVLFAVAAAEAFTLPSAAGGRSAAWCVHSLPFARAHLGPPASSLAPGSRNVPGPFRVPQRAAALSVGGRCRFPAKAAAANTGVVGLSAKAIAVFGATGGVGLETIYQALAKGYDVRALARVCLRVVCMRRGRSGDRPLRLHDSRDCVQTPSKVVVPPGSGGETKAGSPLTSTSLNIFQGDVTAYEDVAKVISQNPQCRALLPAPRVIGV